MRTVVYAFALVLLTTAGPAIAQDSSQSETACANEDGKVGRPDQIEACTALISSGRYAGQDLATLHYNRGVAFGGTGDHTRSSADFSEAIRLDPKFENAWVNRASDYFWAKDYRRSIADYGEAIRLVPDDHEALRDRGNAYLEMMDYSRALADYHEAVRLKPGFGPYRHSLCRARARWGRELPQALADCNEAIALDPDRLDFHNSRGLLYLKRGDWNRAIADFDAAAQQESKADLAQAFFGRGVAEKRKGMATRVKGNSDISRATSLDAGVAKRYADWGIKP